jgi:hypothetical protein
MKVLLLAIGVLVVLAIVFAGLLLWVAAAHDRKSDG